ncbi:MAG: hypothetical protein U9M90_04910, partial [Patescibacteria group bacterium]|nr:hypothetical protein [Patescibacteria group bacterium]
MLSKEIKQLIELSGGKMIISEGDLTSSYVVMKLDEYLEEINSGQCNGGSKKKEKIKKGLNENEKITEGKGLTNKDLLDKINTDIAGLHSHSVEKKMIENFESESKDEKEDEKEDE